MSGVFTSKWRYMDDGRNPSTDLSCNNWNFLKISSTDGMSCNPLLLFIDYKWILFEKKRPNISFASETVKYSKAVGFQFVSSSWIQMKLKDWTCNWCNMLIEKHFANTQHFADILRSGFRVNCSLRQPC